MRARVARDGGPRDRDGGAGGCASDASRVPGPSVGLRHRCDHRRRKPRAHRSQQVIARCGRRDRCRRRAQRAHRLVQGQGIAAIARSRAWLGSVPPRADGAPRAADSEDRAIADRGRGCHGRAATGGAPGNRRCVNEQFGGRSRGLGLRRLPGSIRPRAGPVRPFLRDHDVGADIGGPPCDSQRGERGHFGPRVSGEFERLAMEGKMAADSSGTHPARNIAGAGRTSGRAASDAMDGRPSRSVAKTAR